MPARLAMVGVVWRAIESDTSRERVCGSTDYEMSVIESELGHILFVSLTAEK